MSIEQLIADNTAALKELTEAIKCLPKFTTTQADVVGGPLAKVVKVVAKEKTKVAEKEPEPEAKKEPEPEAQKEPEAGTVTVAFKDVADAAGALLKAKGRDALEDVLKGFKVAKCSALPEAEWAPVIAAIEEALKS